MPTKKSNLICRILYDLKHFFIIWLVEAYFFGPPCICIRVVLPDKTFVSGFHRQWVPAYAKATNRYGIGL